MNLRYWICDLRSWRTATTEMTHAKNAKGAKVFMGGLWIRGRWVQAKGGTCVLPPTTARQTLREGGSDGGLHGRRISYTSKCLLRRQTRSQRDGVHLGRRCGG